MTKLKDTLGSLHIRHTKDNGLIPNCWHVDVGRNRNCIVIRSYIFTVIVRILMLAVFGYQSYIAQWRDMPVGPQLWTADEKISLHFSHSCKLLCGIAHNKDINNTSYLGWQKTKVTKPQKQGQRECNPHTSSKGAPVFSSVTLQDLVSTLFKCKSWQL